MNTSLKKLFEVAGVDITQGKAKQLCESNSNTQPYYKELKAFDGDDLDMFLEKVPNIKATVTIASMDTGQNETRKVGNAKQFLKFAYGSRDESYPLILRVDKNKTHIMVDYSEDPYDDSDEDTSDISQFGTFIVHSLK